MGFRVGILAGVAMTIAAACMFGLAPALATTAAAQEPSPVSELFRPVVRILCSGAGREGCAEKGATSYA